MTHAPANIFKTVYNALTEKYDSHDTRTSEYIRNAGRSVVKWYYTRMTHAPANIFLDSVPSVTKALTRMTHAPANIFREPSQLSGKLQDSHDTRTSEYIPVKRYLYDVIMQLA